MLYKTRGIVFKYFKYRETSIIVKIFTEVFGMQTYVVNGVRSKSAKGKIALYQPLTLLDMVVYHKESAEINRIAEIRCNNPFLSLSTDIRKTAMAMFMAEVLYKTVREEGEVSALFEFIFNSIEILDNLETSYENFHLRFLLKLSKYLGFGVESSDFPGGFFGEEVQIIKTFIEQAYDVPVKISNGTRRMMLDQIIKFYQANVDTLKEVNSIKVLQEVL